MKNIALILISMVCLSSLTLFICSDGIGNFVIMGLIFSASFILFLILLMEELKEKNKLK